MKSLVYCAHSSDHAWVLDRAGHTSTSSVVSSAEESFGVPSFAFFSSGAPSFAFFPSPFASSLFFFSMIGGTRPWCASSSSGASNTW